MTQFGTNYQRPYLLMSWGPGNHGWTPEVPQQAGFPCQMLLEGFWAATHLPLHSLSSLTLEQLWVS